MGLFIDFMDIVFITINGKVFSIYHILYICNIYIYIIVICRCINIYISLWIQPYLLRKWDWGMMIRGLAVPSPKMCGSIGIVLTINTMFSTLRKRGFGRQININQWTTKKMFVTVFGFRPVFFGCSEDKRMGPLSHKVRNGQRVLPEVGARLWQDQ